MTVGYSGTAAYLLLRDNLRCQIDTHQLLKFWRGPHRFTVPNHRDNVPPYHYRGHD